VLQQQVKTLKDEQPEVGEEVARELESIKHFLWHGNTFQALQRLEGLLIDLEFPEVPSPLTQKVAKSIGEFETYIRNNEEFIPNFGERYRNGETISTAFVESTVNQVISKRMVKKQQMQWTPRGHIYCCRPEQRCLTMNSRRYSTMVSAVSAQRPDPDLYAVSSSAPLKRRLRRGTYRCTYEFSSCEFVDARELAGWR